MQYYLKDIKWFYTNDGSFAMPYIISKSKTKIKNILTDEVIDISNGIGDSVKDHYGIYKYALVVSKAESVEMILDEQSKIRCILPVLFRWKCKKETSRQELIKNIGNTKVGEMRIDMACEELKYRLFREELKSKRELKRYNRRLERQNNKDRANRIKFSEDAKNREDYLNF